VTEGDLEAVKDYSERGTTLGLGSMGAEVGEVEEGRGTGSQRLMVDREGRSRRFRDWPPWIREGSSSRGAGDERGI
jgi:hypothetical protein